MRTGATAMIIDAGSVSAGKSGVNGAGKSMAVSTDMDTGAMTRRMPKLFEIQAEADAPYPASA